MLSICLWHLVTQNRHLIDSKVSELPQKKGVSIIVKSDRINFQIRDQIRKVHASINLAKDPSSFFFAFWVLHFESIFSQLFFLMICTPVLNRA